MSDPTDCCYSCKFYDYNICRRYPPVVTIDLMEIDAIENYGVHSVRVESVAGFPAVAGHEWCGEFKEKGE